MGQRADIYMGIGQAINELFRIRDHLLRFGLSEEQQLEGCQEAVSAVGDYLLNPEIWFRFEDLCTSAPVSQSPKESELTTNLEKGD